MKLIPPRTTFPGDITPAEAKLMQQHEEYWEALFETGSVLIIGPVLSEGRLRYGGA